MAAFMFHAATGYAQLQHAQYAIYLEAIKRVMNNPTLGYNYSVVVQSNKSGVTPETIKGYLYRSGKDYVDSNSLALNIVSSGYYLKADMTNKTAYLYNLASVERRIGLKPEDIQNSVLDIPQAMMDKMGTLTADESPAQINLNYTLKEKSGHIQKLYFTIQKSDMSLTAIRIDTENNGQIINYYLKDFSNKDAGNKLSIARYFTVMGKKAMLKGIYKSYKLNAVL
jgi:hypothetical protein